MSVSTIFDASQPIATLLLPPNGGIEVGPIISSGSITAGGGVTAGGTITGDHFVATSAVNGSTFAGPLSASLLFTTGAVTGGSVSSTGAVSGSTLTATASPSPTDASGTPSLTAGLAALSLLSPTSLGMPSPTNPVVIAGAGPNSIETISQVVLGNVRVVWGYTTLSARNVNVNLMFDSVVANTLPKQTQTGLFTSLMWCNAQVYTLNTGGDAGVINHTNILATNMSFYRAQGVAVSQERAFYIAIGLAKF